MWFMNKISNPFVRLILRSPLHGLLSAALLLITYRGCKSGKEYTIPVQYAQDGSTLYIIPGAPEKKTWWHNFKDCTEIQVVLQGKTFPANGRLLYSDSELESIAKGIGVYLRHFPALAKGYNIGVEAEGTFNAGDVRRAARTLVMVQVELS